MVEFAWVSQGKLVALSAYFISKIGGGRYYAKVDNLWGYRQLRLTEGSSKVIAIITP